MKPKTYKIIKDFKILFLWVLFFILNSKLYATNSFINVGSFQSDHEFQNFYNEYSRQLDELFYKRKNKLNDRKYEKISRFNNLLKSDKINEVTEEFPKLLKISKTFNLDKKNIFTVLAARYYFLKKDFNSLKQTTERSALNKDYPYLKLINVFYLASLLHFNETNRAIQYYENFVEKNFNTPSNDLVLESLVQLSEAAFKAGNIEKAQDFLWEPLLRYPKKEVGKKAMTLLSRIEENEKMKESLFQSNDYFDYYAKNAPKYVGTSKEAKDFVFSIISKKITAENNLDELFKKVKLYQFFKENNESLTLLEKIEDEYNDKSNFDIGKAYEIMGRIYNTRQKPEKAVEIYKKIFTEYPNSKVANTARLKYAYSLNYNKDSEEAENFILNEPNLDRDEEAQTFLIWRAYLSKNKKLMELATEKIKKNFTEKNYIYNMANYWSNLLLTGQKAKGKFTGHINQYPFALFGNYSTPEISFDLSDTMKKLNIEKQFSFSQSVFSKKIVMRFKKIHQYALDEFLREELNKISLKKLSKPDLLNLSMLTYMISDFKNSYYLSTKLISQNTFNFKDNPSKEDQVIEYLNYPLAYWNQVKIASDILNLNPFLLLSIMRSESNYSLEVESHVGAIGPMQIMSYTAEEITGAKFKENQTKIDLHDPKISIAIAAWYLKNLVTYYNGNLLFTIAAYNGGPNAVNRWIEGHPDFTIDEYYENIPFAETKKYVAKTLGAMDYYTRIYEDRKKGMNLVLPLNVKKPNKSVRVY